MKLDQEMSSPTFFGLGHSLRLPHPRFGRRFAGDLGRRLDLASRPTALKAALGGAETTAPRLAGHPVTPEQRLIQRVTMGMTPADLELIEELGYQGYLEHQLDYEQLDDGPLEDAIREHLPTVYMTPFEVVDQHLDDDSVPMFQLMIASVYRAIFNPRQLFERMVQFWTDHFNINLQSGFQPFLKPTDDREVIRAHALGTFPDLLRASAHSSAMLVYLTNVTNESEHPNENYARELMELHTLGVDGGYTETDVKEVARCFTGWQVKGFDFGLELGTFLFNPEAHDKGAKVVLGQTIPAGGGVEDGERVLDILANHPSTAEFISRKLLRYFWGYEPPQWRVNRVAERYLETGGDIESMLRLVLQRSWMQKAEPKLKRPLHLVTSAARAIGASGPEPYFFLYTLYLSGHLPFAWQPPNGYPDTSEYWSGLLLPRWNFADEMVKVEIEQLIPLLEEVAALPSTLAVVNWIDASLFNNTLPPRERRALKQFLDVGASGGQADPERILETLGLALSSESFQQY